MQCMARSDLEANTQMLGAINGQTGPQVPEAAIAALAGLRSQR